MSKRRWRSSARCEGFLLATDVFEIFAARRQDGGALLTRKAERVERLTYENSRLGDLLVRA